ncbi:hypothetical protein YTPLAS72_19400 [Nitrospira sp.]|nr:hypothetical protein YTPLAS72_19400 [Nitrospira sp.]
MPVADPPKTEYLFSIYGTPVRYITSSSHLAAPVEELLRHFRRDAIEEATSLTVQFYTVQDRAEISPTLSSEAPHLVSGTDVAAERRPEDDLPYVVSQDGRRLLIDFTDMGLFVIDGANGRAEGYLLKPERMSDNLIEYLFHLTLIELLRHQRLYTIHATALEWQGRGVLIPGNSGRGKTTSFISLLRAGYRYLSDDHPLIRDVGDHVEVLPFPIKINVTDDTIAFFPELRHAPEQLLQRQPGFHKRGFYAEEIYPAGLGPCCMPALVLFPQVVDAPQSHLERISKSRALELVLPQALLVYDQEVARREFQTLTKLVQQVDCYRLHFGRDILDLPKLITPLLEQVC